jgi:hypothetical protein
VSLSPLPIFLLLQALVSLLPKAGIGEPATWGLSLKFFFSIEDHAVKPILVPKKTPKRRILVQKILKGECDQGLSHTHYAAIVTTKQTSA